MFDQSRDKLHHVEQCSGGSFQASRNCLPKGNGNEFDASFQPIELPRNALHRDRKLLRHRQGRLHFFCDLGKTFFADVCEGGNHLDAALLKDIDERLLAHHQFFRVAAHLSKGTLEHSSYLLHRQHLAGLVAEVGHTEPEHSQCFLGIVGRGHELGEHRLDGGSGFLAHDVAFCERHHGLGDAE